MASELAGLADAEEALCTRGLSTGLGGLWRTPAFWIVLLVAIAASVSVWQGCRNALAGSNDFQWDAARGLLLHCDPYVESSGLLALERQKPGFWANAKHPYPLSSLALLVPFGMLQWPAARGLWLAVNLLSTLFIFYAMRRLWLEDLSPGVFLAVSGLCLCSTPWRNLVGNGQHTLVSLAGFFWFMLAERRGHRVSAGFGLVVALIKYTVTAPLCLVLLADRRIQPVMIAVGVHMLLFVGAAAWLSKSPWDLFHELSSVSSGYFRAQQSHDFFSIFSAWACWGYALAGVLFLASVWVLLERYLVKGLEEADALAALSALALLFTFHLEYDAFMLLFFLVPALRPGRIFRERFFLMAVLCYFGFFLRIAASLLPQVWGLRFADAGSLVLVAAFGVLLMPRDQDGPRFRAPSQFR